MKQSINYSVLLAGKVNGLTSMKGKQVESKNSIQNIQKKLTVNNRDPSGKIFQLQQNEKIYFPQIASREVRKKSLSTVLKREESKKSNKQQTKTESKPEKHETTIQHDENHIGRDEPYAKFLEKAKRRKQKWYHLQFNQSPKNNIKSLKSISNQDDPNINQIKKRLIMLGIRSKTEQKDYFLVMCPPRIKERSYIKLRVEKSERNSIQNNLSLPYIVNSVHYSNERKKLEVRQDNKKKNDEKEDLASVKEKLQKNRVLHQKQILKNQMKIYVVKRKSLVRKNQSANKKKEESNLALFSDKIKLLKREHERYKSDYSDLLTLIKKEEKQRQNAEKMKLNLE